jgi:hypothetical protein
VIVPQPQSPRSSIAAADSKTIRISAYAQSSGTRQSRVASSGWFGSFFCWCVEAHPTKRTEPQFGAQCSAISKAASTLRTANTHAEVYESPEKRDESNAHEYDKALVVLAASNADRKNQRANGENDASSLSFSVYIANHRDSVEHESGTIMA